jgi:hypothetical protein
MKETNIFEAITERDTDLLVLEEIHASATFRKWLGALAFEDACFDRYLSQIKA